MSICFFKQKTAYEVRISDWSSDVCSSDLQQAVLEPADDGEIEADQEIEDLAPHRMVGRRRRTRHEGTLVRLEDIAGCGGGRISHGGAAARRASHKGRRGLPRRRRAQIGRASCRERVCQEV